MAIGFLYFLGCIKRIGYVEAQKPLKSTSDILHMSLGLAILIPVVLQEDVMNRASFSQIISWVVSGLVPVSSYLMSSLIWVPVILHYATDTANMLVFNITGRFSFFQTNPPVIEGQKTVFRVIYGITLSAILLWMYGLKFRFG